MKKVFFWAILMVLLSLFIVGISLGNPAGAFLILISMGIAYSLRKNKEIINLLEKFSEGL